MTPTRAIKIASKSRSKDYHRKKGNVIAILEISSSIYIGVNSTKSSPKLVYLHDDGKETSTMHAEASALASARRAGHEDCIRYGRLTVLRFLSSGKIGLSKPCKHCLRILQDSGLKAKNIYYSSNDGQIERLMSYDS